MNTQTVKLDVTKRPAVMPTIYIGQGDKNGTTLVADIYDDGAALTLTGYDVKFRMKLPYDTAEYNVDGTVSGSTATFAIDEQYAASVAGITDVAYVEVLSGSTVICSTNRMRVVVLESAFEGVDPATIYDNGLNDAIDRAIAAAEAAEGVVLQDVPTMTENIKGGAKLGSGLDVTNSVLSLDLVDSATGTSVTADDASYLATLTVDGKAVQNGTPTPSAPVSVEVVQGINLFDLTEYKSWNAYVDSGISGYYYTKPIYLKPNTTYAISLSDYSQISAGYTILKYYTSDGATSPNDAGTLFYVLGADGSNKLSAAKTFTTGSSGIIRLGSNNVNAPSNYESRNPQLEEGMTATPYTPYGSIGLKVNDTIHPIDLQGNVLASLPDGTKDELTVDSSGHVVLTKRVGKFVFDSTATVSSVSANTLAYLNIASQTGMEEPTRSILGVSGICDRYVVGTKQNNVNPSSGTVIVNSSNFSSTPRIVFYDSANTATTSAFSTFLTNNPVTLYYPLATPTTTDLGYIDMPAIPDGATISITAQVTPTISASWWARGAAAIAEAIKALRDNVLARIEAIETAIAEL